ncbi:MAG TPA: hypothetical protein VLF79_02305 [Candidatus Saccharimonadales bacterium]|nr:hypothetical protein [Candidatus Saccharimonadales bacterium]
MDNNKSSPELPLPEADLTDLKLAFSGENPPPKASISNTSASEKRPERAVKNVEAAPISQTPPSLNMVSSTIPLPVPPIAATAPTQPVKTSIIKNTPLVADDDNDLIEKEWVLKAKQIVERTRNDPHRQSEELTIFKADYIKKRYGKTIKVSR